MARCNNIIIMIIRYILFLLLFLLSLLSTFLLQPIVFGSSHFFIFVLSCSRWLLKQRRENYYYCLFVFFLSVRVYTFI